MLVKSATCPCTIGIIAPPKIIITKIDDPCSLYLPKPSVAKSKIFGNITELKIPTDKIVQTANQLLWIEAPNNKLIILMNANNSRFIREFFENNNKIMANIWKQQ